MSSGRLRKPGHDDFQHVQAEVQVAAELALGDVFFQIAIGGGDDADVDLDRLGAADALERMPFEHAEELGLNRGAHLADFVEHERALVGLLELADLALGGAGEGALLVAEQLALQQRLGERRAVEADERPLLARAGEVDGAGDQLLADAALAADEHRGPARRRAGDLLRDAVHHFAGADDLALHAQLLAELHVLALDLVEILGELLPLVEILERDAHRVGHGEREFQVLGIGRRARGRSSTDGPGPAARPPCAPGRR